MYSLTQKHIEKFWSKVEKTYFCWEWSGYKDKLNYGYFNFSSNGKIFRVGAHRVSVVLSGRDIPKNMCVDHLCKNPSCVNPSHLRVATYRQNVVENSVSPSALAAQRTHCINCGLELVKPNIVKYNWEKFGHRNCKNCARESHKKYRAKNRAHVNEWYRTYNRKKAALKKQLKAQNYENF